MKLVNQSVKVLAVSIFLIVSIWAVVFYYGMMNEIYDSIDDGLDNYKMLIIKKAENDSTVLLKSSFGESNYAKDGQTVYETSLTADRFAVVPVGKDG